MSPDQLVIDASEMKIRGGGQVDLRTEDLQIDFVPNARDGLGLSLSRLTSVVRLGRSLKNSRPVADPVGTIGAGATIGAAISTGGLFFLAQGLFNRARSAVDTARGKTFEIIPSTAVPESISTTR